MNTDKLLKEAKQLGIPQDQAEGILRHGDDKHGSGKEKLEGVVDAIASGRDVKD